MRCPESWACSTVSGATAVSSPGPSTGREHEQTAGDGGGEAPELEHALLADSTGRQDGGAQNPPSASRQRRLRDLARGERPPPRRCRAARLRSRTKVWRSRGEQSSCRKVAPRPDARRDSVRGFQALRLRRALALRRLFEGTWPQHVAFVVAQPEEPPHQRDEGEIRRETRGKCAKGIDDAGKRHRPAALEAPIGFARRPAQG